MLPGPYFLYFQPTSLEARVILLSGDGADPRAARRCILLPNYSRRGSGPGCGDAGTWAQKSISAGPSHRPCCRVCWCPSLCHHGGPRTPRTMCEGTGKQPRRHLLPAALGCPLAPGPCPQPFERQGRRRAHTARAGDLSSAMGRVCVNAAAAARWCRRAEHRSRRKSCGKLPGALRVARPLHTAAAGSAAAGRC